MLKKLISNRILFADKVDNWEAAIRLSSHELIEQEFIEESYLEAMIDDIKEFGPYIILTDGVAMPHTRPENGTLKTGLSFLKLKEGVVFPETEFPVSLFFTLSATDPDAHLDVIIQLAKLIEKEETLERLFHVSTKKELLNILS